MTDADLTVSILRDIRAKVDETNSKLDQTNARMNARFDAVDQRIDAVDQRIDETNAQLDKGFQQVVSIVKHHDAQVQFLAR